MRTWNISVAICLIALTLGAAESPNRARLAEAITTEDTARQSELLRALAEAHEPLVQQVLEAWRGGVVYIVEQDEKKIPVLLEVQTDSEGRAAATRISDGTLVKDETGANQMFSSIDLVPADASSKLRKAIKTTLDIFAVANPNPKMRRDAVTKLGQEQKAEHLPVLEGRLQKESDPEVIKDLREAIALTEMASNDSGKRVRAIATLREMRSINSLALLKTLSEEAAKSPEKYDAETIADCRGAVYDIEQYIWWGNLFGTAFRGLSLSAVLLVAALGLAITFGLMGVINMAHGELIMVGAYTTYMTQNLFRAWAAKNPAIVEFYFIPALLFSFITAAAAGLLLERTVIRFLYKRPLESLLATWGVSLVLQQVFRHTFGAGNV